MKQTIEIDVPEGMKLNKIRNHSTPGWLVIEFKEIKPKKLVFVQQFTDKIEPGMYWTDSKELIPLAWKGGEYQFSEFTMKDTIIWKLKNEPNV